MGNDFMAGKYYVKPMVTTISPAHVVSVVSTVTGTVGVLEPIVITFDKPMNTSGFASSFAVYKGTDTGDAYETTALNNGASFNFVWDAANQKVSVTPKVAFEFNRAYKVVVTKANAKDIYENPIDKTRSVIAATGDQIDHDTIEWTFKTVPGTTPNFSVVELIRNRREVTANFSATVIGGQNISLTDAFVGVYVSNSSGVPSDHAKLETITKEAANSVGAKFDAFAETPAQVSGKVSCVLTQTQLPEVDTVYYIFGYVKTNDGLIYYSAPQALVVHPWNLVNNDVFAKTTGEGAIDFAAGANAFVIETAADLTNLNLSANGTSGSDGLKGTTSLEDLQAAYWTQPCRFVQTKDIGTVTFANPIGDTTAFTGTYNGQNYNITSLEVTGNATYAGMFGLIDGATLANIKIDAVTIPVTNAPANVGSLVGSVLSTTKASSVSNVNVTGADLSAVVAATNIGGLVGIAGGTNAITINGSSVAVAATIGSTEADASVGGVVGKVSTDNVSVSGNSVSYVTNGHVVASSGTAGCIVGNETGNEAYQYGSDGGIYTTEAAAAIDFAITGNRCSCTAHHTHPQNVMGNDFMAGKYYVKPMVTTISPAHVVSVVSTVTGTVGVLEPIVITFDKPMNTSGFASSFAVYKGTDTGDDYETTALNNGASFNFVWDAANQKVSVTPKVAFEFNRAYKVVVTKANAKDIYENPIDKTISVIAATGDQIDHDTIEWTFKTVPGTTPNFSVVELIRNRREVTANFSATVIGGQNISLTDAFVGVYVSNSSGVPSDHAKLETITKEAANSVGAKFDAFAETPAQVSGKVSCVLTQTQLPEVDTVYYIFGYVKTNDGLIYYSAPQALVVHPWNLVNNDVFAKTTGEGAIDFAAGANAFVIETAADLTNLNLSANGTSGSDGLKGTTSLEDLQAAYWTQPCRFVQTKDIGTVTFANPIGDTTAFTGTYNGQNYNITSLEVTGNATYAGMFGLIDGATLANIKIDAVTIPVTNAPANVGSLVGSVLSTTKASTVSNVNVSAVDLSAVVAATNIGGLVGIAGGTNAITINGSSVAVAATIGSTEADASVGGVVGKVSTDNVSVSGNSVSYVTNGHVVASSGTAGCIVGNETGNEAYQYGSDGGIYTTEAAAAIDFAITGNRCSCTAHHTHPQNVMGNDFMAGKYYVKPMVTTISPTHVVSVVSTVTGTVGVLEPIVITFDKPMNTSGFASSFAVYKGTDTGDDYETTALNNGASFNFVWDAANQKVSVTPKVAFEFNRAYKVVVTKANAKDIYENPIDKTRSVIAATGDQIDHDTIEWTFKTVPGTTPNFSVVELIRNRREVTANFSATVIGGQNISLTDAFVGVYVSNSSGVPSDHAKLETITKEAANSVGAKFDAFAETPAQVSGKVSCVLTQTQLPEVDTVYYIFGYVKTNDGLIYYSAPQALVVHPWNLVNNDVFAKTTGEGAIDFAAGANAFVIETAADLTNLNLSANGTSGSDGLKGTTSLEDLQAAYWTQPCRFVQTKDIGTVTFANPIGDTTAFTGTYNGQNYNITSLEVTGNATYAGMFGLIDGATLANIKIDAVTIPVTNAPANVGSLVGSVLSTTKASTVSNVNVSAVDLSAVVAATNIGGLVGIAGGTNAITINGSSVAVAATIGSTEADASVGGVVGKVSTDNVSVSGNSVSYVTNGHVVASSGTAGCIVGNETGNEAYQYGSDGGIYTTEAAAAIDFAITGNRCSCTAHHTHPQNVMGNDFMAGKYYVKPMVTTISPTHVVSVVSTVTGTVGVLEPIVITFDKPMNTSGFASSFAVYKGTDTGDDYETTALNNGASFNFVWDAANQKVSVTPKVAFEFNRAYKVVVTKANAKDIYENPIDKTISVIAATGDQIDHDTIEWTFKTVPGTTPNFSVVELIRNRREVTANFSATVIGGQNISLTDAFVGVYVSNSSGVPSDHAKLETITKEAANSVGAKFDAFAETPAQVSGKVSCVLTQTQLPEVDTVYYIFGYVKTNDGLIYYSAPQALVVHPWNLLDNSVFAKTTGEGAIDFAAGANAFVIETAADLTNLNLSANGTSGSDGLKGTTSLEDLQAAYWTQPCRFVQTKDIGTVTFANPIGDTTAFTGTYNGQNYNITSLEVTGNATYAGMFGLIDGATLANIKIDAVTIPVTNAPANVGSLVGSVLSTTKASTVSNVNVSAVDLSAVVAATNIGGLVGIAGGTNAITINGSSVAVAATIGSTEADASVGGVVGKVSTDNVSVSGNSVSYVTNGHVVASSGTAGCIVGNETGHANSLYNKDSITSTTLPGAVEFVISGNTCTCNQHVHPINTKSNDFMAGKNHTKPLLSSILPIHTDDVTHSDVGAVSVYPQITMTFDKPMNRSSVEDAFKLYRHDDEGAVTITTHAGGFVFAWDTDNQRVQATPKIALEFSRAYTAELTKATAKDINTNSVAGIKIDDGVGTNSGTIIRWSFKTTIGDKPAISPINFVRDRRTLDAQFSANVADGADISAEITDVGIYYSLNATDPKPKMTKTVGAISFILRLI
ncbi:MAG: Ig-like domain-containing protein [Candidatus Ozemobacteraceae bacterium]